MENDYPDGRPPAEPAADRQPPPPEWARNDAAPAAPQPEWAQSQGAGWTEPQPEWAQAQPTAWQPPPPEWARNDVSPTQSWQPPAPEWASGSTGGAAHVPLPPPPADHIGIQSLPAEPAARNVPMKRLLLPGLAGLIVMAIGITAIASQLAVNPDSPFYSPERAVTASLDSMNDAIGDNDYERFSAYCDVEGFSSSVAAWAMTGSTVDLYKDYRAAAGKRNADKAWRQAYKMSYEYVAQALEQAVRTGQAPAPGGAVRNYEQFCTRITDVEVSDDGQTAQVTGWIDAAVTGGAGTLTLQRRDDGSWRVVKVDPAQERG